MMEQRFHVVFTGQLHPGFHIDETAETMAVLFHLDLQKVQRLLCSGKPQVIKRSLPHEQARRYADRLEQIGLRMKIIPDGPLFRQSPNKNKPAGPAKPAAPFRPATPTTPVVSPATLREIDVRPEQEEAPGPSGDAQPSDPVLPPFPRQGSHGWLWVREAIGIFFLRPWRWSAIMVMALAMMAPLSLLPYPGIMLASVLAPILLGGMMVSAQRLEKGGQISVLDLFRGAGRNFFRIFLVGVIYLLLLLILALIGFILLSKLFPHWKNPLAPAVLLPPLRNMPLFAAFVSAAIFLAIPLAMGCWFAPCLVCLGNRKVPASLYLSFKAVSVNIAAFLNYGLILFLLGLFFLFLYGLAAAIFSFLFGPDNFFLFLLMPVFSMALLGIPFSAIVPLSVYAGYKDIFLERESPAAEK